MANDHVLRAWSGAVGRELSQIGGYRFTRATAQAAADATDIVVESTLNWSAAGRALIQGTVYDYASVTFNGVHGLRWDDKSQPAEDSGTLDAIGEAVTILLSGASVVRVILSGTWTATVVLEHLDPVTGLWVVDATYTANADEEKIVAGPGARLRVTAYTSGEISASVAFVARSGLRQLLKTGTVVVDFSRTYNALDAVRANLLVDTATGKYLDAVARNHGVIRPPNLTDDDDFRRIIRAMAYFPKGTIQGLEIALTAFFGAGNFEIREDFPTFRNTVFIRILNGVGLSDTSEGNTYLMVREYLPLDTGAMELEVTGPVLAVQGARLRNEDRAELLSTTKPSAITEIRYSGDAGAPAWTFFGTNEAADVTMAAASGMRILTAPASTAGYFRTARIRPESTARFAAFLRVDAVLSAAGTSGRQFAMNLRTGARDIAVGFISSPPGTSVGFIDSGTGSFLGTPGFIPNSAYRDVEIRLVGGVAELWIEGSFVESLAVSAFPVTALNEFRIGAQDATYGVDVVVKTMGVFSETLTDYWNLTGVSGDVSSGNPVRLDTNSGAIVAGDSGKYLRTISEPTTGDPTVVLTLKNNGVWRVSAVVDSDRVDLSADERLNAFTESGNPARVTVANIEDAFRYPHDVGKRIQLASDDPFSPNDGVYLIDDVLDPVSGTPLTGDQFAYSNKVAVSAISPANPPPFTTETDLRWRLLPNFETQVGVDWELAGAGSFSGTTLTLRANPPLNIPVGYVVVMEPIYSSVESGQLLVDDNLANDPAGLWHPFYLPQHPLGPFASFADDLTVAGVIPEYIVE